MIMGCKCVINIIYYFKLQFGTIWPDMTVSILVFFTFPGPGQSCSEVAHFGPAKYSSGPLSIKI